jgi:AbrB family looped-hinge helix DNA binding protein
MSSVTSKGQATIPLPIRKHLGISAGDDVQFLIVDGEVVLRKSNGATAFELGRDSFGKWSSDDPTTSTHASRKQGLAEGFDRKHG